MNTSEREITVQNPPNRTDNGQTFSRKRRLAETHQDYWIPRLRKRSYLSRDGEQVEVPTWQVRLTHLGREAWFNLGTANQVAAAAKARDIWVDLHAQGWIETLAKYKPKAAPKETLTIDEFADFYRKSLQRIEYPPSPQTAARYIKSLQFVCRNVRITRIADLTGEKVQKFKGDYMEQARKEGRNEESAKMSCNAMLRNSAAIFSRQMLAEYTRQGLSLFNPFENQKLRRIKLKSYSPIHRSTLDAIWRDAAKLRDGDPQATPPVKEKKRWKNPNLQKPQQSAYILLLLELGLGLRRHEADKAQWDWLYTDANGRHYIEVRETPYFRPKSKESRIIPVEKLLFDALHATRSQVSPFIVPGRTPKRYERGKEPKNLVYRCDQHHRTLAAWLRDHGIKDEKPCHTLRKEFGSYVATAFGLFHAQRMLGHSSPQVTEAFYAGLTQLPELKHAKV